jgi:hypothetical protein
MPAFGMTRGYWVFGSYTRNSERPQQNCADKRKDGEDSQDIEFQGKVHKASLSGMDVSLTATGFGSKSLTPAFPESAA